MFVNVLSHYVTGCSVGNFFYIRTQLDEVSLHSITPVFLDIGVRIVNKQPSIGLSQRCFPFSF
jgi:hypothetical protein